jgi:MoxR-like ATPase
VDEINRAMPRTQSALLEAMAEHQITADGETRSLPIPFLIVATQNPLDHEGTFPLPEAQLDRFFLKATLGYPTEDEEVEIVQAQRREHPLGSLGAAISIDELRHVQSAVEEVYIDPLLQHWLIRLVRATRDLETVAIGGSVRGSLALERAARAWALLQGRDFVVPEDVDRLFVPVLVHRIVFKPSFMAEARKSGWSDAIERFRERCLELAPRPTPDELAARRSAVQA